MNEGTRELAAPPADAAPAIREPARSPIRCIGCGPPNRRLRASVLCVVAALSLGLLGTCLGRSARSASLSPVFREHVACASATLCPIHRSADAAAQH